MKRLFTSLICGILFASAFLTASACGYRKEYDYTATDPGTLAAPRETFATAEEDPAQNAKYREQYPTLKRYDEPVTVTVAAIQYELESNVKKGTDPETQSFNKIAKDVLNIDLKYTVIAPSTQYDNRLNLQIAGGDMPDMFYTTSTSLFTNLRDDGQLADLTEAYYSLNDKLLYNYENYMQDTILACQKEGKLYALPQQSDKYASAQRLYIRKDWLEIAGVEAPTTIDEMIAVGQAFLDNKDKIAAATGIAASNVIPFTMHKDITYAGSYSAEGMFNAHGASLGSYFLGSDGKLYCSNTSDEAKAALQTMRTMYDKGILDKEFISSSAAQVQSFVSAGFVGMVFGEWWLPKDALGSAVESTRVNGADWVWVDLPSFGGSESLPIVDTMLISGYNLVSKDCKHPEAVAKLINLFYDIYYNDNAQAIYGDSVLPSNGFYYQFVPVKVWDGMASATEFKRVNKAFDDLYAAGLNSRADFTDGLYEEMTSADIAAARANGEEIYEISSSGSGKVNVIKRSVINTINADPAMKAAFASMRNREKILHFADGYPYFVAYRQGISTANMTDAEKRGWGIYHEMIDENGSYAYVVALSEGQKKAKYDEFYGVALSAMADMGDYLTTLTGTEFTKFITGANDMKKFNNYVKSYDKNGGSTIIKQVNEWYEAVHQYD